MCLDEEESASPELCQVDTRSETTSKHVQPGKAARGAAWRYHSRPNTSLHREEASLLACISFWHASHMQGPAVEELQQHNSARQWVGTGAGLIYLAALPSSEGTIPAHLLSPLVAAGHFSCSISFFLLSSPQIRLTNSVQILFYSRQPLEMIPPLLCKILLQSQATCSALLLCSLLLTSPSFPSQPHHCPRGILPGSVVVINRMRPFSAQLHCWCSIPFKNFQLWLHKETSQIELRGSQ